MARNIFIDLGSFRGDIIRKFMSSPLYSPDFEIHAFESNPLFTEQDFVFYPSGIIIHREAVGIVDGNIPMYVNKNHLRNIQGTSICRDKITGDLDSQNPIDVKCIDFARWLRESFAPEDNIIVKCNIEGAEYPLFDHFIKTGTIRYIKRLFLRVHWHKIGMQKADHDNFMFRLNMVDGLKIQHEYKFV